MRRCTFYVPNVPSDSFLTTSSCSYQDSFHHPRDLYALRWGLDNGDSTNRWHIAAGNGVTTHLLARTSQAAAQHSPLRHALHLYSLAPYATAERPRSVAEWEDRCAPGAHLPRAQVPGSVGQSGRASGTLRVFKQFTRLEVGSGKVALSRPGRAPGWCSIPLGGRPATALARLKKKSNA
jgi:hypothetical protein